MIFSIPASELKTAVQGLARVQQSGHMPVLACVYFAVTDNAVAMATTNLTETLTYQVSDPSCEGAGRFLCPIADLKPIAKAAKRGSRVTFEPTDDAIVIRTDIGGNQIARTVATIPVEEWPVAPDLDLVHRPCGVSTFVGALRCAFGFASKDSTREIINGVLLGNKQQVVVGTDGRRLAVLELPDPPVESDDIVVPRSKVLTSKLLEQPYGTTAVHCSDGITHLSIEADPWSYLVRVVDGTYPNYEQVIPKHDNWLGTIEIGEKDVALLKSALPQFPEAAHDAIAVYADAEVVAVVAGHPGEFTHVVLGESRFTGEQPTVRCVNRTYLMDALTAGFTAVEIPVEEGTPMRSHGERAGLHVLMPLRDIAAQPVIEYVAAVKPTIETPAEDRSSTTAEPTPAEPVAPVPTAETTPAEPVAPVPTADHKPDLQVIMPEDPIVALRTGIEDIAISIRAAADLLRTLKKQAREVERSLQKREKEIMARERKVLAVTDQLAGLKDAVGF